MNMDAVCLGHCAWDFITIVQEFPRSNTKIEARELFQQGGGPAATAAVTLTRLGAKTAFIGKVGDDNWGQQIVDGLAGEGVATRGLIVEHESSSPISFVTVEKGTGKRTIIYNRGTVSTLTESDINTELLLSGKILLIDSLHPKAALSAATMAKESGIRVVLDSGAFKPHVTDLLGVADVIIAPEYFAQEYGQSNDRAEIAQEFFGLGSEIVVITQGEKGGMCFTKSEAFEYPGFQVDVVDTTGAGDVFHGAFVYGLLHQWDLEKTASFASAVAALNCTKLGGRTGIPSLMETFDFLKINQLN